VSRNRSSKNDWRRYIKFEQENEKLRKEVNKLRKVVNTMVIDQLEQRALKIEDGEIPISSICEVCGNEDLHIVPIKRPDGNWEIKLCKSCNHRQAMQKSKEQKEK